MYTNFYYRYYRLIKRTEQRGPNKKQYYVVQTCLSSKKLEKFLIKKRVKWKDVESGTKENIEAFFDQKTIEKKVDEILLSPIKKAILKPKFLHKFREKNNILKAEINVAKSFLYLLLPVLLFGLAWYSPQPFYTIGVAILILIIACVFYIKNTSRFLRVIEKRVHQGRYEKTSYHIQSFISKKNVNEIAHKKTIKWTDYYPEEFKNDVYREEVEAFFDRKTTEIEVIDDVL
ncbi:hypothetical protein Q4Q35_02555 [Flavivirga aquimarina]|uniref:Uncharacterized protein n=1 Tax=Flavivirga aquimarina TaxID=2027862 RepID=A0ABT8W6D5_9FLAO|nr:hypothetical protein [Flavivirga aquimarina]MDO5968678.1 hypothetical protein [Flavivirga aquimarina]